MLVFAFKVAVAEVQGSSDPIIQCILALWVYFVLRANWIVLFN